jgi:hypothetical protein
MKPPLGRRPLDTAPGLLYDLGRRDIPLAFQVLAPSLVATWDGFVRDPSP